MMHMAQAVLSLWPVIAVGVVLLAVMCIFDAPAGE